MLDEDGDGMITVDEVASVMEHFGGKAADMANIQALVDNADLDKNGAVDYVGWLVNYGCDPNKYHQVDRYL